MCTYASYVVIAFCTRVLLYSCSLRRATSSLSNALGEYIKRLLFPHLPPWEKAQQIPLDPEGLAQEIALVAEQGKVEAVGGGKGRILLQHNTEARL